MSELSGGGDLFWRLAHRARADGALQLTAQSDPEFGRLDEEPGEAVAVTAETATTLTTPPAPIEHASAVAAEGEVEEVASNASVEREIRLVPMPVVVPPSGPAHVAVPWTANVQRGAPDLPTMPGVNPLPGVSTRIESVPRHRDTLSPVPLLPEPKPGTAGGAADGPGENAPPIEVTIGRIEVRVRPPAPVRTGADRRPVEPAPALTLAEYLQRRETSS